MNKEIIIEQYLKKILIDNSSQFLPWKEIYDIMQRYLLFELNWKIYQVPSKEQIRLTYFKELQKDLDFIKEYGIPITKNGVGVKLTKDLSLANKYIEGEHKRAISIFKNSKPVKEAIRFLSHHLDYTEEEGGDSNEQKTN